MFPNPLFYQKSRHIRHQEKQKNFVSLYARILNHMDTLTELPLLNNLIDINTLE